jgi:hypothetical protein
MITVLCEVCLSKGFLNAMRRGRKWGLYYIYRCRCGNHALIDHREVKKGKE